MSLEKYFSQKTNIKDMSIEKPEEAEFSLDKYLTPEFYKQIDKWMGEKQEIFDEANTGEKNHASLKLLDDTFDELMKVIAARKVIDPEFRYPHFQNTKDLEEKLVAIIDRRSFEEPLGMMSLAKNIKIAFSDPDITESVRKNLYFVSTLLENGAAEGLSGYRASIRNGEPNANYLLQTMQEWAYLKIIDPSWQNNLEPEMWAELKADLKKIFNECKKEKDWGFIRNYLPDIILANPEFKIDFSQSDLKEIFEQMSSKPDKRLDILAKLKIISAKKASLTEKGLELEEQETSDFSSQPAQLPVKRKF